MLIREHAVFLVINILNKTLCTIENAEIQCYSENSQLILPVQPG